MKQLTNELVATSLGFRKLVVILIYVCSLLALRPTVVMADRVFLNDGEELPGSIVAIEHGKLALDQGGTVKEIAYDTVNAMAFTHPLDGGRKAQRQDELADHELKALLARPVMDDKAPYEIVLQEECHELAADGSSTHRTRRVVRVVGEKGMEQADLDLDYLAPYEKGRITMARSIGAERVVYADTFTLKEGEVHGEYPRYNRLRNITVSIPEGVPGRAVEYEFVRQRVSHDFRHPFWGEMYLRRTAPAQRLRLKVVVPHGTKLASVALRLPSSVKHQVEQVGNKDVHLWQVDKVVPYYRESQAPSFPRFAPTVRFAVTAGWEAVLSAFCRQLAVASKEAIVAKVAAGVLAKAGLKHGAKSRAGSETDALARVQAIYRYMVEAVRQVAVEPVESGYEVHAPAELLADNAANPLDQNALFAALLQAAGVQASLVLVATEDMEPPTKKLALLQQFDSAAVMVELVPGQRRLFAVDRPTMPFGLLPKLVEGGHYLDLQTGAIAAVPVLAAEENGSWSEHRLQLDGDGDLTGSMKSVFKGYGAMNLKVFKYFTPAKTKALLQQGMVKLHPALEVVSYRFEGLDDDSPQVTLSMEVSIADYAEKTGKLMLFRLPGFPAKPEGVALPERELPLFWPDRESTVQQTTVVAPAGYSVSYLPADYTATVGGSSYQASYEKARTAPAKRGSEGAAGAEGAASRPQAVVRGEHPGTSVTFASRLVRNQQLVSPADYRTYKDWVEKRCRYTREWVILERK